MKTYKVNIERTETYTAEVEVEAESEEDARAIVQKTLDVEGWDGVCDEDGDYQECYSSVVEVTEVAE